MTSTAAAPSTAPEIAIARALPLDLEIVAGAAAGAAPPLAELRRGVVAALAAAGVREGHVAVALVPTDEIRRLNREHRGRDEPTDVLSFPVDERPGAGPRELGDVVICPEQTDDPVRAAVHGALHLAGHDHEVDGGEMLALEDQVLARLR